MEDETSGVIPAVSSVLSSLAKERQVAYNHSSIKLVDAVENKYPLADIIMKSSTGEKVNGNLVGDGTADFHDGHTYEGEFHCGVMHGEGRYTWKDGVVYQGQFTDCHITGEGTYTWLDGSSYTGEVLNGLRHGRGTFCCPSSVGSSYSGQWDSGKRHGKGKLVYGGGGEGGESWYEGDWVDNQQEGWGTRRYRSGNVYEGEWSCNERHGRGTMHWYDRGERYSGDWVRGVQEGEGEHFWFVGNTDNAQYPVCNRYIGEWRNGQREGFGTFYYASGAVYTGGWKTNKKHGWGKLVLQNGRVFEGSFESDRMVGGALQEEGEGLLRPRTPLGSLIGDVSPSDLAGSTTEKFNLNISQLIPPEANIDHELNQVYCVILCYITQLKKIYHYYSSLGRAPHNTQSMTRMQFWRLLLDCRIHHCGLSIFETDSITSPSHSHTPSDSHTPPSDDPIPSGHTPSDDLILHDPMGTFLMREFLQALTFLSHRLYHQDTPEGSGSLSQCLSRLIKSHLLDKACAVQGPLYSSPDRCQVADQYHQDCWGIYQSLAQLQTHPEKCVKLRQILLLLKKCGLLGDYLSSETVVGILVEDNPLAVDQGDYNLEVKVTFLEFFEALLQCAWQWYSRRVSLHEQESSSLVDGARVEEAPLPGEDPTVEQVSPSPPPEETSSDPDHPAEASGLSATEKDLEGGGELKEWKNALHIFFSEHLFPHTKTLTQCT